MFERNKIKKYWDLQKQSLSDYETLVSLGDKLESIHRSLFVERLQPTKGFFRPKVMEYVEPKNWKLTDPCKVIIFRHGVEDYFTDEIRNEGTVADVKEFACPHFKENTPCTQSCRWAGQRNEYLELGTKLIPEAQKRYVATVDARRAAWKEIFARKK